MMEREREAETEHEQSRGRFATKQTSCPAWECPLGLVALGVLYALLQCLILLLPEQSVQMLVTGKRRWSPQAGSGLPFLPRLKPEKQCLLNS